MSLQMENILRMAGQDVPVQKRILELNVSHPVIKKLMELAINNNENNENLNDIVSIIYDQALILEGARIDDPAEFVKRLNNLMEKVL